jgi:hypothetical protein
MQETLNKKVIQQTDHSFFTVKLFEDGIIHVNLKGVDEIDIDNAREIINGIGEFCRDKKRPVLVSSDSFAAPTPEARKYLARAESNPYSSAAAYLTKTLAEKIMTNAFIRFNRPERPTRMFTAESKAMEWLRTFL